MLFENPNLYSGLVYLPPYVAHIHMYLRFLQYSPFPAASSHTQYPFIHLAHAWQSLFFVHFFRGAFIKKILELEL